MGQASRLTCGRHEEKTLAHLSDDYQCGSGGLVEPVWTEARSSVRSYVENRGARVGNKVYDIFY
jgi:hypothetical protein